jgi:hypothetical protein
MDTQTQIDRLIELAIVQRTDLKKLVSELPQLREHLSAEIERTFDEFEPQLRTELEEFCATRADDKHAKLSAELGAKIESFSRSLKDSAQAKFSALLKEREENVRVAKEAEAKIAEHAASLPSAVKEIVDAELSRFPRAGEIDQLRKEFQEPRGLNPRGKWQSGEVYNKLDLVAYNGDSFVSNTNGNRERPNRASEEWTLNAARGNSGGGGGIASLTDILPIPSSGQILGSEGPNYTPKTLVAGANITITETPTQITITGDEGQIELQDGTAAAPSLFFVNDVDTGLFRPGTNLIGIAAGGQAAITIGATEMTLNVTDVQLGGDLSIDNDTLFIDKANSRVGIGTSTPEASLVVRSQGSTNSRSILVEHNDNTTAFSQAKFIGARSRGSHGSPSAVLANDSLASFNGRGYKASEWSNTVGGFYVYAAENWTNTATGSFAAFRLAATGGTTVSEVARLTSTGNLLVGTTTDSSNGRLQLATHTTSAGGIGFGTETSLFRVAAGKLGVSHIGGTTPQIDLYAGTTLRAYFLASGTDVFLSSQTGGLYLRSNNTTAITLDSSQNATFAGRAIVNSTTASTSTTTGSLVLSGGLGVAGALYIGGLANVAGNLTVSGTQATFPGPVALNVASAPFIFTHGSTSLDSRALFISNNPYALALQRGSTGGKFYIGASADSATPGLTFSDHAGSAVATLSNTGGLSMNGNLTVSGGTVGTAASTNLTLAGGSSGASLVLGQGTSGGATFTVPVNSGTLNILQNGTGTMQANVKGHGSGTNPDATSSRGATLTLTNLNATDGNGSVVVFQNSGELSSSYILGLNNSHASRTGAILFGTANGSAPSERARITSTGNLLIGGTTDITGSGGLKVFGTTASTSTTTGALQVAGGVGVAGAVNVGGTVSILDNVALILGTSGGTNSIRYNTPTLPGIYFQTAGSDKALISANGNLLIGGNSEAGFTGGGGMKAFSSTASTSTTTGALQVVGGVGVGGAMFIGGAIAIGNTVNTVSPTSPDRTITIVVGGTTYYIAAKTTND